MINLDEHIATHINGAFIPEGNVCWIATVTRLASRTSAPKAA